jgi:GNAT superfamily N-acetyltransferase
VVIMAIAWLPRSPPRSIGASSRQGEAAAGTAAEMTEAGAISIAPVRSDADIAAASRLARDFFAYLRATYPEAEAAIDAYLVVQDFEGQLAGFREHFNPPHGECMLARLDGAPVGVVMLKPYAPGVCELNRMYVAGAARGRGVGRGLCERLIARARELGYHEIRLDALNERIEALPLYRALGFAPDPDPPAHARDEPGVISLRMLL